MAREHDRAEGAEAFEHKLRTLPVWRLREQRHCRCVERIHNIDDPDVALRGRDQQRWEEERRDQERGVARGCSFHLAICSLLCRGEKGPDVLKLVREDEGVQPRFLPGKKFGAERLYGLRRKQVAVLREYLAVIRDFLQCFNDQFYLRFFDGIWCESDDMCAPLSQCF